MHDACNSRMLIPHTEQHCLVFSSWEVHLRAWLRHWQHLPERDDRRGNSKRLPNRDRPRTEEICLEAWLDSGQIIEDYIRINVPRGFRDFLARINAGDKSYLAFVIGIFDSIRSVWGTSYITFVSATPISVDVLAHITYFTVRRYIRVIESGLSIRDC